MPTDPVDALVSRMLAADTREAILVERRDDPCFILATSGLDVPPDTPPENIHALREAAGTAAQEDA